MSDIIRYVLQHWLQLCLSFFLILAASRLNLKQDIRSRQLLMVPLAFVFLFAAALSASRFNLYLEELIGEYAAALSEMDNQQLQTVGSMLDREAAGNFSSFIFALENALILIVYLGFKRLMLSFLSLICVKFPGLHRTLASTLYDEDEENGQWYLREDMVQVRSFMAIVFWSFAVILLLLAQVCCYLLEEFELRSLFYPVCMILFIGEMYFVTDGRTGTEEQPEALTEENTEPESVGDAESTAEYLKSLFGDHLSAWGRTEAVETSDEEEKNGAADSLAVSDDRAEAAYGLFLKKRARQGFRTDPGYIRAGQALLGGSSVLFHDPFYKDLIPYIFYPMHHFLLEHGKALIISGRQGAEQEVLEWTAGGLSDVTGISSLWHTGMICRSGDSADYSGLDAAVMPRSMVYDIEAHESIRDFLKKVSIVVIIEPSALLGAAQMGLDSVTESVYAGRKRPVFCAMDRNCDGLVDTLSHVLKTELTQVSATNHHSGASTYMIWDGDSDHLQHRMLPNISRYLGLGTELGAAAVKNGFRKALWYGGSRFPVADIQWIGNQYYYELLKLCGKKPTQENFGRYFMTDSGLWNASEKDIQYITVEDENRNMFEIRRSFATRAVKEGFVNIISPAYLLRDYMADNDGLFENDPKAVPTIVPDYVRTVRNTVLRLCLRMSIGSVWENDIRRELERVNVSGDEPGEALWRELCRTYRSVTSDKEEKHYELPEIRTAADGIERIWNFETFRKKRKFNTETGCMENLWSVSDRQFIRYVTAPLRDIKYIAEDDTGNREHLGAELQGQLFQKHLPGQFMTLGGKYYEVLRVVRDGSLLLQRAADHITGRPEYRQVRQYVLKAAVRSEIMGESRHTAGMQTDIMYADISVRTPAYWQLDKGNDFAHGSRISINGIPERSYSRKKLLKLTFAEGSTGLSDNVRCTLVLLMNEVIRTMFSDQADFLAVVTSEQLKEPLTYHLQDETKEADSSAVYIIEDSQLDLGLLEAVRRNLRKILETCCDYLEWHTDRLEGSKAGVRVQTVKRTGGVHIPEGPVSGLVEAAAESAITAAAVECVEKAVSGTTGDIAAKAIGGAVGTAMGPVAGAVVGVAAKNIIGAAANGTESADPYSTRSAYCERHYLLYGGETCPEWIDAGETVSFLKSRGFGNGELKQARKGADKNN